MYDLWPYILLKIIYFKTFTCNEKCKNQLENKDAKWLVSDKRADQHTTVHFYKLMLLVRCYTAVGYYLLLPRF